MPPVRTRTNISLLWLWRWLAMENSIISTSVLCWQDAQSLPLIACFLQLVELASQKDIFSIDDLKGICDRVATTFIDNGDTVFTWWDTVVANYSNIPGVRMLHDFLVVKSYNGEVMVKVREHCYEGSWTNSPTLLHLPFQLQPIGRNIIISYQLIKWQKCSPCMTGLFPLATVEHICHLCNKS